jgi:streptomycin 6-kinase
LRIPSALDWWREVPGGAEWLDRLPAIVHACVDEWDLRLGAPYEDGNVGLAVRVARRDGTDAVLKVNFPEAETEHEAAALAHWSGHGAVYLLERDDALYALLVERCEPGTQLWEVCDEDEANTIAARVLARVWRPPSDPSPFRRLEDEAARWAHEIPASWEALGRPFERAILEEAVAALRDLGPRQEELVVCHQDFHGGNVLRATREPWLAIDPKPLVGERAFDAASLLRDRRESIVRDPQARRRMRRRLDLLSSELGLERERMRGWAIGHALAWGIDAGGVHADHVECARLLMEV